MKVFVWLNETSVPMKHEAKSTYTKGPMFCVMLPNGDVVKYPVQNIFRVREEL